MTRARLIPLDEVYRLQTAGLSYKDIAKRLGVVDGSLFQAVSIAAAVSRDRRRKRRGMK